MTLCDSHSADLIRREFLQVGFCGFLGFGLADLLAGRALAEGVAAAKPGGARAGTRPRARSMILVFLTGGLSHLDSLDMKPDAPAGIRGEFRPIATRVPGIQVCEHLPELAARAEKLAIVRSLAHTYTNHLNATHELLTGHAQPGAFFDKTASRDDYPCYAAGLDTIRPRGDGIPSGVRFRVDSLSLPMGFSVQRMEGRQALLEQFQAQRDAFHGRASRGSDPMSE